ncbi:MAG TPA: DUF3375 domain-containing protein, partial [Leptospiraceae bacterium]|nr:DUF3375 domain-containing protein [Leptospiraceae bacterium]
ASMEYEDIQSFLDSPAVSVFRMDSPAVLISFLFKEFKDRNEVSRAEEILIADLDSHLHFIRQKYQQTDEERKKQPGNYLTEWSNKGYLRKYYLPNTDQAYFELTPVSEKILNYIEDLSKKHFVGTESRLLKIFEILNEIAFRSSDSPEHRISELEKKKQEIISEIEEIQSGKMRKFSGTQIRERYFDLFDTSRRLLSDFREVENNFREIDLMIREAQMKNDRKRSELLSVYFEKEDILFDTDQGRSFLSFFEFLMSHEKQEELSELIRTMLSLPEIKEIESSSSIDSVSREYFFRRLKSFMMQECMKVNKTGQKITEGLRKFIAVKTFQENRRISEIIKEIKSNALSLKNVQIKKEDFMEMEGKPEISLIMERPLYSPSENAVLQDTKYSEGDDSSYTEEELSLLYKRIYVDKDDLKRKINEGLKLSSQISVSELLEKFPADNGLLEVVGYFSLASEMKNSFIDEDRQETVSAFNRESRKSFKIKIPSLVFTK